MHLTNNSVAKHSDKFYSQAKYENNMMSMQEFATYISVRFLSPNNLKSENFYPRLIL